MQIADKVFVVTGAANGIGRQVALGLAQRGGHIAAIDMDEAQLTETADFARSRGATVSTHAVDVTDREAVMALPEQVLQTHDNVDGLVNIAGVIHRFARFTDLSPDDTDRVMLVNFSGTVNTCRAFLPGLLKRPEANVTNMSSLAGLVPFASQSMYSASKAAVKQFSESLYGELCDTNVHVVTVFPGNVDTYLTTHSGVEMLDAGDRKVRSTPPEVAGEKIVDGIARNRFRVVIGTDAHVLSTLARLSARRATRLVAKQIKAVL